MNGMIERMDDLPWIRQLGENDHELGATGDGAQFAPRA